MPWMTPGAWRALPQACARQGRRLLPRGRPLLRLPRPCRRQRPRRGCPCSARRAARSSAAPGSARACASPSPRRVRIFRLPSCLQRPYSSQSTAAVTDTNKHTAARPKVDKNHHFRDMCGSSCLPSCFLATLQITRQSMAAIYLENKQYLPSTLLPVPTCTKLTQTVPMCDT